MKIPYYQINAFTISPYGGNPAGVCILQDWLSDHVLQNIAAENNLSETAFIINRNNSYDLRWFTPTIEVDLCGHATLASAFVVFSYLEPKRQTVSFQTKSGLLVVSKQDDKLELDFPAIPTRPTVWPDNIIQALGTKPDEILDSQYDLLVLLDSEQTVKNLKPEMSELMKMQKRGLIATAKAVQCDFVSRFFAPQSGIPEDPVTGSSFCTLAPFWSQRLNKTKLYARQISQRSGEIFCEHQEDRVKIAGQAVTYLTGHIHLEN